MAKFNDEVLIRWETMIINYLGDNGYNIEAIEDVKLGVDAWDIAHNSGIMKEAYTDPTVFDAHIQTALERLFPNCVFRDRKVY